MIRSYAKSAGEREGDRKRLSQIQHSVLAEIVGSAVSADQAYREADLAIDFQEDVPALASGDVARIVDVFQRHGATAKVSSIHVNGWFGTYDKLSTSLRILSDEFGIDARRHPEQVVFVGDSPNDAPMFAYFPNAVGVANTRDFAVALPAAPTWITMGRSANGFTELADLLLAAREPA